MPLLYLSVLAAVSLAVAAVHEPALGLRCSSDSSCASLLVVVDGTGSRSWLGDCNATDIAWTSHSNNFYEDYQGAKLYYHGPDATYDTYAAGDQVLATVESAYAEICEQNPESVDLIGHSRGGYAVMELARKLEATPCSSSVTPVLRFMGLYDPVSNVDFDIFGELFDWIDLDDHAPMFGDVRYYKSSSMMPRNVDDISVAYGDSDLHSRWFFKTCLDSRDKDNARIDAADFMCTHGAIGGAPGKGDFWQRSLLGRHNLKTEMEQAMLSDLHIRTAALAKGVPVAATPKDDYKNMRKCARNANK